MSDRNTETRVVKMEFDNAKFEKEVKQSMNTIDKFDKKLRFDGVSNSIEKVTKSFSILEVSAITAIANITNKLVNLGIRMVKSLSIDNIASGWDKFGEKTTAVATMAAQKIKIAGKELTNYSEKMEAINEQLDKLNWFTDETSYNFTDMVNSIGKFTAAGQDLDVSVKAMMGIANWAALSGQNATKASSAMYQLAQAMGKGYVQLIDWKSIQNLSMDTVEFRETVLNTAVAMGELSKEADKFITKTGKKFTINQFAEELNSKWFTTDVLVKSLGKYSEAIERIYEISQETGLTASEVMKRYGSELDDFGLKAFKAAQEARTLADAIVSVKDAVSTGWMNTAEKIFGGYDESKELWTDLANELYDVFAEGGNFRNEILGMWNDLGGRADLFKHGEEDQGAFWNIYDSIIAIKSSISDAWETIFPKSSFESYNDQVSELANNFKIFTDRLKTYTATIKNNLENNKKLFNIMQGLFSLVKIGALALNGIRYALDPIWTLAKNLFSDITDRLSYLISHIDIIESVIQNINNMSIKLHDTIESVIDVINPRAILGGILNFLIRIKNTIKDNAPIKEFADIIKDFFNSLKENGANAENFARIMNGVIAIFDIASKFIIEIVRLSSKYLVPVLNVLTNLLSKLVSFAGGAITHILALVGDIFVLIDDLLSVSSIDEAGNKLNDFIDSLKENAEKAKPLLQGFIGIFRSIVDTILLIPTLLNKASIAISGKSIIENLTDLINSIKVSIESFNDTSNSNDPSKALNPLAVFIDGLVSFFKGIHSVLSGAIILIGNVLKLIGDLFNWIGETISGVLSTTLSQGQLNDFFKQVLILGGFVAIFIALKNIIWGIQANVNPLGYALDNLTDALYDIAFSKKVQAIGYVIQSIGVALFGLTALLSTLDKSLGLDKVFSALHTLIIIATVITAIAAVAITIKAIVEKKNVLSIIKNTINAITKTKDDIQESVDKSKKDVSAAAKIAAIGTMIQAIGFAMIEIAIAMKTIGSIKTEDMWKGLAALALFGGIITSVTIFSGVFSKETDSSSDGKNKSKGIKNIATIFLSVALAFKTLSKALATISAIDPGKLWMAIGAIGAVFAIVTLAIGMIVSLGKQQNKAKQGIKVLNGGNVTDKSSTSKSSLTKNNGEGIAAIFLSMAGLMLTVSAAIAILTSIDTAKMWSAVGAISALMAITAISVGLISKISKGKIGASSGKSISQLMAVMTVMVVGVATALAILANQPFEGIIAAAAGFSLCMLTMIAALKTIQDAEITPTTIIELALAMAVIGGSLFLFAAGMKQFSDIEWMTIGKGAAVVAGAFLLLAAAGNLLKSVGPTILFVGVAIAGIGAGLYLISASLPLFLESFMMLTNYLNENSDDITGAISGIISILIDSFLTGIQVLVSKLTSMLPTMFSLIETFIMETLHLITTTGPALIEAIITLIDSTLKSISDHIGSIMESLMTILLAVLDALIDNIFAIANKLIDILIKLIEILTQRLPDIMKVLVDFLIVLVVELFKNLGPLIDKTLPLLFDFIMDLLGKLVAYIVPFASAVTKLVLILISTVLRLTLQSSGFLATELISFFGGLILLIVEVVKGLSNVIYEALKYIFVIIVDTLARVLHDLSAMFIAAGMLIGASLAEGLIDALYSVLKDVPFINDLLRNAKNGLNSVEQSARDTLHSIGNSDNVKNAIRQAGNDILDTVGSVTSFMGEITDKGLSQINDTVNDTLSGVSETISTFSNQIGGYMADGLEQGADENRQTAEQAGAELSEAAIEGAKEAAGVHSPSTEFIEIGKYMCEGLIIGINENQNAVIQSAIDMMNNIISSTVNVIDEALSEDLLTITPVIDLSKVRAGANDIAQLMTNAGGSGISVTGDLARTASNEINASKSASSSTIINNTTNDTYNATFNVTTDNPQEFSEDVDKELQRQRVLAKLAKGGAY